MIIPEKKKEIAARLKEALLAEHLYNAQAAKCLNLIPNYITMMLNHRMWDHCPAKAWNRTEEALSLGKISEFKIPKGEKIVDGVKAYKKKGNALITATEPEKKDPQPSLEEGQEPVISPTYDNYKEQCDNYLKTIRELLKEKEELRTIISDNTERTDPRKVSIDIEINLIINGRKVLIA